MKNRRTLAALALALLCCGTAFAEVRLQLPTAGERKAADIASWATVITVVVLDAKASWDCQDRTRCFELQGIRTGVVYGSVFAAKLAVHRARPCAPSDCGIDNPDFSFFSAHTAIAFSTIGGPRLSVSLPLAISTGGLRVAAGKHWVSDTLVGAGVGYAASFIR